MGIKLLIMFHVINYVHAHCIYTQFDWLLECYIGTCSSTSLYWISIPLPQSIDRDWAAIISCEISLLLLSNLSTEETLESSVVICWSCCSLINIVPVRGSDGDRLASDGVTSRLSCSRESEQLWNSSLAGSLEILLMVPRVATGAFSMFSTGGTWLEWSLPISSTCEPVISALILASTLLLLVAVLLLASLLLLVTVFSWIGSNDDEVT